MNTHEQEARELLAEKAKQALLEILAHWRNENVPDPPYAMDRREIIEQAIATLTAQRDKAVEALRPFAEAAEAPGGRQWDIRVRAERLFEGDEEKPMPTVQHFRQAAAVVKEICGK